MKGIRSYLIILVGTLLFNFAYAQDIGIGEWRDHLPYYKCISVTEVENKIYAATPYSLFYFDQADNMIQRLSKVNGLSDIGVSVINYNTEYETLLIAYTNTNIDLLKDNEIINISDIKRKPILGNKSINNIIFRDKFAYLACGFGIVVLDTEKEEIFDTYYIGPGGSQINVYDLTFDENDSIFAATEHGIYKASLNSPNLADFSSWTKDSKLLYPDLPYNFIEYFAGKIFANYTSEDFGADTVFIYDYNTWQKFGPASNSNKRSIKSMYGHLLFVNFSSVDVFDETFTRIMQVYSPSGTNILPQDAIEDDEGNVWIADKLAGLIKTYDEGWSGDVVRPNGPRTADVFDISLTGKDLWVAPGGRNQDWGNIWKAAELYSFVDNEWSYLNQSQVPEFEQARDIICILVDPENKNRVYAGSWGYGLFEILDNQLAEHYTEENSTLQTFTGTDKVNIGGIVFDNNHNLWIANSSAGSIVSVKMNDGTWQAFNLGAIASGIDVGEMIIDHANQKWMLVRDHGLLVFSDNNTITNVSDDKVRKLNANAGNGNLPGLKILSFAVDQDGELWIGSDEGVAVIYSPESVFTGGNFDAQRILVEQDGYVQYLLETEAVTAITIDGANRKWFGTDRAGVFLMSQDGTEQILNFTIDNSPLLSNSITSIEIDSDGEVFFGTAAGIVSYRGTATPPIPPNGSSEIYTFPNPVREDYNGPIAIKGVPTNADIKITDISGTLVYSTRAEGSQAIWDGRNFSGDKARTGVYLVFISNSDGSETEITKILIVN